MTAFETRLVADVHAPGRLRSDLTRWLKALEWPVDELQDLVLAVSEAVSNSVEHAYPASGGGIVTDRVTTDGVDTDGVVRVVARQVGDHRQRWVEVTVDDSGRWREPPAVRGFRGRGLDMITKLTDVAAIDHGTRGTTVRLTSMPVARSTDPAPDQGMSTDAGQGFSQRTHWLEAVTDSGLASLSVEQVLAELLKKVRQLMEVDTTAALLLDPSHQFLIATAACGLEEEVHQGVRIPLGRGFAGRIAAERRWVALEHVDHRSVLNPILWEKGIAGDPELLEAARRLLTDDRGVPLPVIVTPLTPERAAALPGGGGHSVTVPPDDLIAAVLPGRTVSGAVVVSDGAHAHLLHTGAPLGRHSTALLAAVAGLSATVRNLRAEASVIDALHATGRRLTAQLDLDRLVQDATDSAVTATGAQFGAFFYNLIDEYGESYTLYTISGVPREKFSRFPMPRNTDVFAPTFDGTGTVRSSDITADPRFGRNAPHYGMPRGHLPVCSYLAVPVISPSTSAVLGGFFFGHPEPDHFTARHEYLAEGIAGYAAIALDNARLYDRERNLATELARSMVPKVPPVAGTDIVARYLPAAAGTKIGGDWYDVIVLPDGAIAYVIGDVVGHGVVAATLMGQIRTAIRSYALLGMPPAELLERVSRLCATQFGADFATCLYAVHHPGTDELTIANAGHLAAIVISPGGEFTQAAEAIAQPLGIGRHYPEIRTAFPPGATLVLYTDGLVETRTRDLTTGIDALLDALSVARTAPNEAAAIDEMIDHLTGGRHDDDVALLHVRRRLAHESR